MTRLKAAYADSQRKLISLLGSDRLLLNQPGHAEIPPTVLFAERTKMAAPRIKLDFGGKIAEVFPANHFPERRATAGYSGVWIPAGVNIQTVHTELLNAAAAVAKFAESTRPRSAAPVADASAPVTVEGKASPNTPVYRKRPVEFARRNG